MRSSQKHNRIMAFDFGTKHIGVAFGQSITLTANGIARIKAQDGKPEWKTLDELISDWKPDFFVIGLPLNMDGSKSDMSFRARKFANRLSDRFNIPHDLVDERLTSMEARNFKSTHHDSRKPFEEIDSLAAAIILESWFSETSANKT